LPMRVVTVKMEEELVEAIDVFARLRRMTRSELIRRAVREYLEKHGERVDPSPKIIRILS